MAQVGVELESVAAERQGLTVAVIDLPDRSLGKRNGDRGNLPHASRLIGPRIFARTSERTNRKRRSASLGSGALHAAARI